MPYKKKPYRKKRTFKRGKKLTKRQKKEVKTLIARDVETKCFNGSYGEDSTVSYNGTMHDLSNISVGTGQGNRIANLITIKRFWISFYITLGESLLLSPDSYCNVRIILFRWREDSAVATPLLGDILDSVSSLVNYSVQMPYNYNTRQKYEIIMDKIFQVAPEPEYNGSSLEKIAAGPDVNKIRRYAFWGKKLGAKRIKFDDGSNHGFNKLYACYISDSGTTPHPVINWCSHLYYDDA